MRVIVYHSSYGCESGCCGHIVELDGEADKFLFIHPGDEDPRGFAEDLVRAEFGEEHVKDLDWENCSIIDD